MWNEEYEDLNDNGQYDEGEPFIDEGEPAGLLTQALSSSDKGLFFNLHSGYTILVLELVLVML